MVSNVKLNNYRESLVEVEAVLSCLKDEDYNKIPEDVIEAIETNKDEDYVYEYDENLDFKDWNLMLETKAILYNLFKKYLATDEQRKYFDEKEKFEIMRLEREKSEKYSSNIVFKKQEKNKDDDLIKSKNLSSKSEIEEQYEEKSIAVRHKEKWYKKIFSKLKKILKKN